MLPEALYHLDEFAAALARELDAIENQARGHAEAFYDATKALIAAHSSGGFARGNRAGVTISISRQGNSLRMAWMRTTSLTGGRTYHHPRYERIRQRKGGGGVGEATLSRYTAEWHLQAVLQVERDLAPLRRRAAAVGKVFMRVGRLRADTARLAASQPTAAD